VCQASLTDVLQSVVSGADGCVFTFGPARVGKLELIVLAIDLFIRVCPKPCAKQYTELVRVDKFLYVKSIVIVGRL